MHDQVIGHRPNVLADPRALDGVLWRRVLAFVVDYVIMGLLMMLAAAVVFVLGIFTLGLGWMLYAILFPAVLALYVWNTLGGPEQATIGMRVMNIKLQRLDGARIDGLTAVVHTMLFWAFNAVLTPLILLATLSSTTSAHCMIFCWARWSRARTFDAINVEPALISVAFGRVVEQFHARNTTRNGRP